jgi:hypothetical protein
MRDTGAVADAGFMQGTRPSIGSRMREVIGRVEMSQAIG